jgi:hypothetical protein
MIQGRSKRIFMVVDLVPKLQGIRLKKWKYSEISLGYTYLTVNLEVVNSVSFLKITDI